MSLSVWARVEETVTVTGASPVVDVQSTQNQVGAQSRAPRRAAGGAIHPGRRRPGAPASVSSPQGSCNYDVGARIRNSADQHIYFDGMNIGQNLTGIGQSGQRRGRQREWRKPSWCMTPAHSPRRAPSAACAWTRFRKKAATNSRGAWRNFGSKGAFQGDNVTDEISWYIKAGTKLDFSYETNGVIGGPIQRRQAVVPLRADNITQFEQSRCHCSTALLSRKAGGVGDPEGWCCCIRVIRLTYQASPAKQDHLRLL